MDPARDAPKLLAALFDDGGATWLAGAGLPERWDQALDPVPVAILAVKPGPEAGWHQLAALRDLWTARNQLPAAIAATRTLHQRRLATVGRDHPDCWLEVAALGALLQRTGAVGEGATLLDQAWTALRSVAGGRDLRVAVVAQNVAAVRVRQDRWDDAEHALEVAHRIRRDVAPQTTGLVAAQLGEVRLRLGRPADAVGLLQEAAAATAKAEGPTSPRALARAHMLGTVYGQLERYKEAAATLRPLHAALGPASDPEIRAGVAFELGVALHRTGVKEEGLRRLEEALRLTRTLSDEHPALANRIGMMAQVHVERGRLDEAEGLLREAMELDRRRYGDASAEVAARYAELGQFLARYGRPEDGIGFMDAACSLLRSTVGDADPRTVKVVDKTAGMLHELAAAALARRDRDLAVGLLSRATELAVPVLGHGHERMRRVRELKAKHKLG